jgi:hypothetical protein
MMSVRQAGWTTVLVVTMLACRGHWPPVVSTVRDIENLPVMQRDLRCIKCGEAEAAAIARRLQHLEYAYFNTTSMVTDRSVLALASITSLRQLVITDASRLSDASLSTLSKLSNLRELILDSASGISDVGMEELAESHTLERIYLSDAPNVTGRGIQQFRSKLPGCIIRVTERVVAPPNPRLKTDVEHARLF